MEAPKIRAALLAVGLSVLMGASYRTANFVVETADPAQARQYAETAERLRHDLTVSWLGQPMPRWASPCMMQVRVGPNLGAGGATTFVFDRGEVYGWRMNIQGSHQRILDSVLPHEITHMILATHFRCPLPRWADEGAATSVEHRSERMRHRRMLVKFLQTGRGIPFNRMFALREYPRDVMPLYAQGLSVAEFLIAQGGRRKYIAYLEDGLDTGDWTAATKRHYAIPNLGHLQQRWLAWVAGGCPKLPAPRTQPEQGPAGNMLADGKKRPRPEPNLIYHIEPHEAAAAKDIGPANPRGSRQTVSETASGPAPAQAEPGFSVDARNHQPLAGKDDRGPDWHTAGDDRSQPNRPATVAPQMARPQPFERSRQIILEWERH